MRIGYGWDSHEFRPGVPLKIGGLPPNMIGLFVIGFLLNAAWGIGWALFLALFERLRAGPG